MSINLIAPVNQLGYGVVGFHILGTLAQAGHSPAFWPIGNVEWETDTTFVRAAMKAAEFYNPDAPSVRIWHQNDMALIPGRRRIGWPIFELDRFTPVEKHHLGSLDKIIVCSDWAKAVVERELPGKEVHVVPLGVSSFEFAPNAAARDNRVYWTRNRTVFLNVGKWEVRKGHPELIEAFCRAFKPGDNVELWMVNENPFIGKKNEEWKARYLSSPMGEHIKILPRIGSRSELGLLYNSVDFGVFPAHAEGWNLEALEMMACGVPSIVTNYSGHTQFCNEANSLLVQPNGMKPAQDGIWFHGQGEWCDFSVDELARAMQEAHEMKQDSGAYAAFSSAALETAKQFSWQNSVNLLLEAVK